MSGGEGARFSYHNKTRKTTRSAESREGGKAQTRVGVAVGATLLLLRSGSDDAAATAGNDVG